MYVLTKQLFTPEMNRSTPFVLLLLALVVGITAAAQDAKEIIVTSNNKLRGNTSIRGLEDSTIDDFFVEVDHHFLLFRIYTNYHCALGRFTKG